MSDKVAVFSITRDRLEYTKKCFERFWVEAYPFDWYVLDNGSMDGTPVWLINSSWFKHVWLELTNLGLSRSYNQCVRQLMDEYDYIVHLDNDCYVISDEIVQEIVRIYTKYPQFKDFVLSPSVCGIQNQPMRHKMYTPDQETIIGEVHNLGHLFMVVPTHIYKHFMAEGGYPESLAKARGHDVYFCEWLRNNGYHMAYVENLFVWHYRTTHQQALDYPEYWKRKKEEQQ